MISQIFSWQSAVVTTVLIVVLGACSAGPTEPTATPTLDPASPAGLGEEVFRAHCATCHALAPDTVIVGPSLAGIGSRAETRIPDTSAEDYLLESILAPDNYIVEGFSSGTMQQNFAAQLTSEEIDRVIAFLLTQR